MEQKYYKGYLILLRCLLLPFLGEPLRLLELGIFLAFVIECDWDRRHSTYGCLVKSDADLARLWGCNLSTIWRYKKKLIKLGLLIEKDSLHRIKHFEWFGIDTARQLAKIPLATEQELIAKSQEIIADVKEDFADVQNSQVQNRPQSFSVSSKKNLSLSKEYKDSDLSEEDMKWIDENIS